MKKQPLHVPVSFVAGANDLNLPQYQTEGAAGMDLLAAVSEDVEIGPGERELIPCGISVALPMGYEAQVRSRSGLALKHGVAVLNSPGTIDCDYRGEIGAILINTSDTPFVVTRGARIAQLVVAAVTRIELQVVEQLPDSARGSGGFGHTGKD